MDNARGSPLTSECSATILIEDDSSHSSAHGSPSRAKEYWTICCGITLFRKDLQQIQSGKELSSLHVNAFQNLLKRKYPHIGGLQSTLLQKRSPLKQTDVGCMSLQIIHTRNSHSAALQICDSDVCLYDSAYTSASTDTLEVIAQLLRCKSHSIKIEMMNIAQQTGTTDCALYAMEMITWVFIL